MVILFPKPKISREQLDNFLKDPEVVTLEILFVTLTLCNVFVLYRILLNICPFPVVVTWFQLFTGFIFAFILGEASEEFPRCAFFPRLKINMKLYEGLAAPTFVYLGMITMANVLLKATPSVATFPVAVSLAVALHHVGRFFGCGQVYLPARWLSLGIMFFGFFIAIFDRRTMGFSVFPLALLYAVFSAIFRAWCLEKAMHVVEGKGNTLHNHQVVMGLVLLPVVALFLGEGKVFSWMPGDITALYTYQAWGCLITAGTIPFIKNVIANRMIRRTGQAPWRVLEVISMLLVFLIGGGVFDSVTFIGTVAFTFVIAGRILGMFDALSKDPDDRRRAIRQEASHGASYSPKGGYDPTGIADSFDRTEDKVPSNRQDSVQPDIEMSGERQLQQEPSHTASRPLLTIVEAEEENSI